MRLKIDKVLEVFCEYYEIEPKDIFIDSKKGYLPSLRHLFFLLCSEHTKSSPAVIANYCTKFGRNRGYKRSNIRINTDKLLDRLDYDKKLKAEKEEIEAKLLLFDKPFIGQKSLDDEYKEQLSSLKEEILEIKKMLINNINVTIA